MTTAQMPSLHSHRVAVTTGIVAAATVVAMALSLLLLAAAPLLRPARTAAPTPAAQIYYTILPSQPYYTLLP